MYRDKYSPKSTLGCTSCTGLGAGGINPQAIIGPYANTAMSIIGKGTNEEKARMATETLLTGGLTLIPVIGPIIGKILGPITGIIGGLFKKATHMGDCMKWWDNENNIRSLAGSMSPIPISMDQFYAMMDKPMRQRFDERQAKGDSLGINSVLNVGNRQNKYVNNFVAQVRANPESMQMSCLSQSNVQRETGQYDITPDYVGSIFSQFRQQAQEAEYNQTLAEIKKKMDIRNILQITSEQWGRVETKREAGSLIPSVTTKPGVPFTFPVYTSGGSLIQNVGPAVINRGFPIVPKVK